MEHHAGDFSVTVRDVRQLTQPESDLLTLLWVLEGSVNLAVAEGASQLLAADGLAIVNRNRRWSLRSAGANAVMILTLSASWLARLDNAFFAVDYQITPRTRDADDGLRRLMRQLLVSGLVNHPGHYRLEANRWLSEIALLLATRFSQPIASTPRRDTEKWSRRIASVVARIDANYQRRLSLQEVAAAEFVSEAWLSRLFRKEVGVSFVQYLTALRLRHAADQLLTTRKTVQQIAREQGFASTRMMSDLFKRQHGVTPRQYREQHPLELARPRPPQADRWQPVAVDRLYARLNEPEPRDRESPPLPINPPQTREINLRDRPARPAALRHTRMVVTVRELDDLLREDVRRELEQLHHALPVYAIDINDPFLSSRLFGTGWDDPQMAGYACWYNLQQIFSWLAAMGWQVILHTGVTTRSDLLQRFLQLAANHFPPATLNSWRFVWHWSPQASEAARQAAWRQQRGEILVHDKNLLLLHHQGHYQLLLRNTVVYNPWLSSEAAFIQRFSQPYSVRLQGLDGSWRIKQHLFDQHHGALFPLVDAFRSRSGPDAEDYQWLMHRARPALSVDEARLDGYWLRIDSLQSNALVLYEFTPQSPTGP
ncbi:AraC family transcriptional regulator [Klebsiella pneumoniae]|uniref:helix-turn-helix domain-containing protein n=1 Tax=Klebsiella pneumoniae TaxID=573 RepID=UPI00093D2966|nr:helix-turn-helix transcriptional regulator [Klebsiella pneumoniae]OKO65485.1 AraC family transcriptional regulator [Klebsiella pneumoniae]ONG05033.1 AraC family transcriptional regulator [Klebsiella pneumoniae]OUM16013.1 AraC family transcriptional regulator [Klebsiella pneumoniae]OXV26810.1 AraC family transcriptional regulator [Klebsiella pneumoniae]